MDPEERIMIRVDRELGWLEESGDSSDDKEQSSMEPRQAHPLPLFILSIRSIFKFELSYLDEILPHIPPGLYPDLLKSLMIYKSPAPSVIAIRFILKHWPSETFRISEIGIDSFGDRKQECLIMVLKGFLDGLGHINDRQLKTLDLRGTELGDMDFLKNYKALLKDPLVIKTGGKIYLDLNITYANDYLLWNEILPKVQGVLKVAKLSTIFRTGFDSTKLILDALDEEVLTSLVAKHLEIINPEFILLVDSISRLHRLTELDLSCGNLRLSLARSIDELNTTAVNGMSKILHSLPLLKKLNLSNNKLGSNLEVLFSGVEFRLHILLLKSCGLWYTDVLFLEGSVEELFFGLEVLDLGDNNLSDDVATFVLFLSKLTQLKDLSLEDCNLKETHARPICIAIKSNLKKLNRINLAGHKWSKAILLECVHSLVPRPALVSMVLPNYGLESLQFKFKARRTNCDKPSRGHKYMSQILEPVAGECSEVEEIRRAVESYKGKSNGFKSMDFKMTWIDGMLFSFKKF